MRKASPRHRAAPRSALVDVVRHLALVGLAVIVVACGASGGAVKSPSLVPGNGAGVSPSASIEPWPPSIIQSVVALGAADAEVWKAAAAIAKAADAKDVQALWGAADGTVKLIQGLQPNVDHLATHPDTKPLADAYNAAFPVMLEGATQLRDSITAGDAAGVVAGSKRLAEGAKLYADVRAILPGYVAQAENMQKHLVK